MRKPHPTSLRAIDITCPKCGQAPDWGCLGTPNAGPHQARVTEAGMLSRERNRARKETKP